MTLNVALEILSLIVLILCMLVLLMGAMYFEEWEAGIEFMPMGRAGAQNRLSFIHLICGVQEI